MQMSLFLQNKIKRQLQCNGQEFSFTRFEVDEFNQISSERKSTLTLRGLFHTTNGYVKEGATEGARIRSKPQPMILTLYAEGQKVQRDDEVEIRGRRYKVIQSTDVNNFGVVCDISLRLIDE